MLAPRKLWHLDFTAVLEAGGGEEIAGEENEGGRRVGFEDDDDDAATRDVRYLTCVVRTLIAQS
jgi:hypothetical protein